MSKKNTKRIIRIVLLLATVTSLFFVPWTILFAWLAPLPDTVQEQAEEALSKGFDGIIIYVDRGRKEPAYYAAGWHDRDNKIPAYPHAYFKIASISKLYDAVAVTRLVHDGRLSLDKTLADYFPDLVGRIEYADKITLRMMVQHRSGIPNVTDIQEFWANPPASNEEAIGRILDLPADFKPGTDYAYSNTNYILISDLIEKVTGNDKYRYFKEEIFIPLGLEHTFGSVNDVNPDQIMSGYYVGISNDIKSDDYGTKLTSMIATAEDVGIFLRALNDGSVFREGEQEIYTSIYTYGHTGLMPGYQSIARYHGDIDAVVVQFTNTTDFGGYNWHMSEIIYGRIVKILRKEGTRKGK